MSINWNSIIEGTSAGIAASAILASLVILRENFRNVFLKYKLSRIIKNAAVGDSIDGVTTSIQNKIGWPFVVRELSICTNNVNYRMNPTGEVRTVFRNQHPKLTKAQKKALEQGQAIEVESEISWSAWRVNPTVEGFIRVEPYTSHEFILPNNLIIDYESNVQSIRLILEYISPTGYPKILKIEESKWAEDIHNMILRQREALTNGNLNELRRRFGKPPIHSQRQPQDAN